ncbi:amidase [Streptococcus sp. UMB1385]|nr:amidase [Streptococcus sp. UMB1385]
MKKKNLKYVFIPAFAATTLFPVLANDNQAYASENSDTVSAPVNNTANNKETSATETPTSNTATNSSSTTDVTPNVDSNNNEVSTTNSEENITSKPTIPFTVAEYKQKSALELAKLIREKKVTSTELVDLAYKVIADETPKLNAVLTTENGKIPNAIVDEAYRTAKEIDERINAGNLAANPINWEEQPFLGVPTLIKGLDLLKDGDASNGVYFNKGKVAKGSGAVAKEFAKLGFVILGQTNYPELGTRNITDSKLFGPAGNPWDPSRNTGGSSGGSAGAVASGMVSIASGSDAGGSIRIPASWTGLIGLKPTGHVVKFPLVKTIEDAKTYFDKTQISKPKTLEEVPTNLKKLKIAYTLKTPLKDVELSEDGKKAVLKAVEFLRKHGFTVEEINEFPIDGYEGIRTYTIGAIGGAYTSPAKAATEENKRDLDPATYALGTSTTRGKTPNTDTSSAKSGLEYINQMNEFYKKYDLFLMATNAVTAPSNDKKVDPYVDPAVKEKLYNINEIKDPKERFNLLVKQWEPMMRRTPFTWLFNLTGNPAISLPVYKSENNLPLGVMFAAKNNSEKILLEMGQLFQDNNQFIMHPDIRNTVVAENGNKVRENEYGTKYEYSVPNEAPVAETLKPFTGKIDGLSENGNKVVVDKDGIVSEFNTPSDVPVVDAPKPFTGKIDGLSDNGNKVVVDENGNVSEFNTPTDAPVADALKPFTGKIDGLSANGNKVIIDKDGNVSEFNTTSDAPVAEALKPFTEKIDGLSENGNKVVVDKDGNVSEFNTPSDAPVAEALKPFTGNVSELSENGNKIIVDKDGNVSEFNTPSDAPVAEALKPFTGKVVGLSENGNKVIIDKDGIVSEFNTPSDAPVADAPIPFTGKVVGLSENGNKVVVDKDGNVSEFNTPSDAPVADAPIPFTGKIDGLSENGNKVVVDKDGNVSESNIPSNAPVADASKSFTGKVDGLSENGNKIIVDKDSNISEFSKPKESPSVGKLPELTINNDTTSITIKSNDDKINVELDSKYSKDISFKTTDITNKIDLEELKAKIINDKNNEINNKDKISSIRVLDLELQNNNKKVNLNIPRTVHVALLQNEQNKEILVYHIKEDNTIELVPSSTKGGNLQFTVNHFSKFAIIAKIKTALASNEKDINTSAVQEEKKFTVVNAKGAKSTPKNPPKTLPKTGETTNKSLTLLGISLIVATTLLKRRKNK